MVGEISFYWKAPHPLIVCYFDRSFEKMEVDVIFLEDGLHGTRNQWEFLVRYNNLEHIHPIYGLTQNFVCK